MDLKLEDVAQLLNVSESTVLKWLDEGLIPAYSIKEQPRFSRMEIENWMINRDWSPLDQSTPELKEELDLGKKGWQQFCLFRAIHKGEVFIQSPLLTKEMIISKVMEKAASTLNLDAEVLTEMLIDREKMLSTAINHGIAVPHTRDFLLKSHHDIVIVVYLDQPIDWGAMDGELVHTLFFLFACDDVHHLNLLAKLAHLASDQTALKTLKEHPSKEALLKFVKNWESGLK